ncbi:MAG TPA: ATP-binding protein [Chloroflexota bacterium]|jgi:DNA replication protein DnaC
MKQAPLPQSKSLDEFDWAFNPKLPKQLILDLATLRFISERGGALIIGPAGLSKSHICISVGVRAVEAGYTVLYRSAFDLAEDLAEAAATGTRKETRSVWLCSNRVATHVATGPHLRRGSYPKVQGSTAPARSRC